MIGEAESQSNDGQRELLAHLTPRQREVLEMASRGLTNRQIAASLGLTVHAVKFHLGMVYRALHVANRTEAAFLYLYPEREKTSSSESAAA